MGQPRRPNVEVYGGHRGHTIAVVVLLVIHGALCWLSRQPGFLTGQDDVEYMALGQSLRHGGYNMLFRVDQPLHAQYPPGYPALLAVWGAVFGDGFSALAALSLVLSVATIGFTYVVIRRLFGATLGLLVVAVLAFNPELVQWGGDVASEPPYMFFSVLSLVLLSSRDRRARVLGSACGLAILAALTRSAGVTLIGAVGLTLLVERRWRAFGTFAAVSVVTLGAWTLWTAMAPEQYVGMSYIADLTSSVRPDALRSQFLRRAWHRVTWYPTQGVPWALAVPTKAGTLVDNIFWALVVWTGVASGLWAFARRWHAAALYLVIYSGLLFIWPWRQERFVIPLLPLVVALLLVGWSAIGGRWGRRMAAVLPALVALAMLTGGAVRSGAQAAAMQRCRGTGMPPAHCLQSDRASFFAALRYIQDAVPEDAVFLTAKAGALWAYTGRQSISYGGALAVAPDTLLPYLREQGAEWVLLTHLERAEVNRLQHQLAANCNRLELVAFFPERTYLFRVANSATDEETTGACEAVDAYRTKADFRN